MEAADSSEALVSFYQASQRSIENDNTNLVVRIAYIEWG
jgi:hypothetical protein